ncbi:F-box protein At5g67140 isoform X3 [Salvia hispanica]|uniref:F-box protein At5g67140 isoform X3 n=1 Tax=Salvia hispanica TaxID=49212 RepID=UPI002009A7A3|nr:F-box protein At5g67140 isoform X3 [Salvia hispanica]
MTTFDHYHDSLVSIFQFLFPSSNILNSSFQSSSQPHTYRFFRFNEANMWPKGDEEADIDRLPVDLLAHVFSLLTSFKDLAQSSGVCRKWRQGVKESLARKESLSFSGWKTDDDSTTRLVQLAYSLKDLDISRSRWGCQITDHGLKQLSTAKCIGNLSSISLWGSTGITDIGVVQMISRATSLHHLNIGGTFITDVSLFAIADSCPHLKML